MKEQTPASRPSETTLGILRSLVGFKSVSRNPNLDLIEWTRAYLERFGVRSVLTYGSDRGKANLFATLGEGPGGVVLSGHTDVVPVDGQPWQTDPFELVEEDGRLLGRGTADMKGFIAVVLAKVPDLLRRPRGEPIHLALSFDEEIGCLGVRHLLNDLEQRGVHPRACIIGEPTSMQVVVGHKTGTSYTCEVEGLEAHGALAPFGVNAIEYAARLIVQIRNVAQRLIAEERRHEGYEVPHSTLQTGVIEGGHASNIVPRLCRFRFDMRSLPWTAPDALIAELEAFAHNELVPEMRRIAPHADIRIQRKGNVPGFAIDTDAALVRYVRRVLGNAARDGYVAFGSEAGLFQQAGIASVICGPGSIRHAHKPDEYVELEQLAACEMFIERLAVTPFTGE
jgi:acetylornithine deacetylase